MPADRRTLLACTGALLAGMAGCLESDDSPANGDDTGAGGDDSTSDTNGNGNGDVNGNDTDGFGAYPTPVFPELEFVTAPELDEAKLAEQIRGNVAFSIDLLEQLRAESPEQNIFCSPYSVSVALAMTYAGARGETANEMASALRYELGQDDLHPAFGALEAEFARRNEDGQEVDDPTGEDHDGPAFQLSTANTTWGQQGYGFDQDFLDLLEAYYGAGMQLVDFVGSPEDARQQINEWVEAQTEDRIEDLLPENSIRSTTRLVLTNAIYFVAMWKYPFDESQTSPGTFTGLEGQETTVDMMHQSIEVPYAEIDGHQLVELPYANDDTSMVVIVPAAGEFASFEDAFSVDRLAIMLGETTTPEVELTMPKFELESKFSLVEVMENLGMERAFGGGADFSGMVDGDSSLFISEIVHQSFVAVDELGTEAAAATAVVMDESGPMDHVELTVDGPFLFYIRDRPTETVLFAGRVVDGETLQAE